MRVEQIFTDGPLLFVPKTHSDARGAFREIWQMNRYRDAGLTDTFVQDNVVMSAKRGTVRGLHMQRHPHMQGKLVSCLAGKIRDAIVDVRAGSKTYGQSFTLDLSADGGEQIWVPPGFLHGYATLTDATQVLYKVTGLYAAECELAVRWNDPDLDIAWGVDPATAHVSEKDARAPLWQDFAL